MLHTVIDCERYPLADAQLRARSKATLERDGVLLLPGVLKASAVESIHDDALQCAELAYYTQQSHNIYLEPPDPAFSDSHARNRQVQSSKGCITTDQVPDRSALKLLYDAQAFRSFLCAVLDVSALFEYADPLSSINIHYAAAGQELGWHFDNSAFAITLLLQAPLAGGVFEYVQGVRDAARVVQGEAVFSRCEVQPVAAWCAAGCCLHCRLVAVGLWCKLDQAGIAVRQCRGQGGVQGKGQ